MNLLTGPSLLALAKSIYYRYDIPLKGSHKLFQNFKAERYKRSSQLSYSMAKTIDSRKNKTRVDNQTNGDAVNPKAFQLGLSHFSPGGLFLQQFRHSRGLNQKPSVGDGSSLRITLRGFRVVAGGLVSC